MPPRRLPVGERGPRLPARKEAPWGARIPEDVFLNDVLPYANIDEARDPWRKKLYELCMPLVKDCKTPAEAARKLNGAVFTKLKVRYSTQRKQANQSPKESIEQGLASCTRPVRLTQRRLSERGRPRSARRYAYMGEQFGQPYLGRNLGPRLALRRRRRTRPPRAGPRLVRADRLAGSPGRTGTRHLRGEFPQDDLSFPLVWAPDRKDVYAENVTRRYAKEGKAGPTKDQLKQVEKEAGAFFKADEKEQAKWKFDAALDAIVAENDAAVRAAVWKAYQAAPIHEKLKADYGGKQVHYENYVSPYVVREVGAKPAKGWPLVIAMHGGGGAPKQLNDSQWKIMQRYYKDHPEVTGYKYLALRAPNDTWNGFYDDYVPPLVINLIRQFTLFGGVDPNRVFLIGYSHGGYGAFFIGPKIPDRFAAIHSSAAAPTDGTISAANLRNTHFTFMVGGEDNAYGRRERCEKFAKEIQKLKDDNKGDLPGAVRVEEGIRSRQSARPRHAQGDAGVHAQPGASTVDLGADGLAHHRLFLADRAKAAQGPAHRRRRPRQHRDDYDARRESVRPRPGRPLC